MLMVAMFTISARRRTSANDEKADAHAHCRDEHAGDRGPHHAAAVEGRGIESHRVGEVLASHQLGHERLASRDIEGEGHAEQRCQDHHVPDRGPVGEYEGRQRESERRRPDLC
jgi:hypothetical protein